MLPVDSGESRAHCRRAVGWGCSQGSAGPGRARAAAVVSQAVLKQPHAQAQSRQFSRMCG